MSSTGGLSPKIGLKNFGQTCYLNSALQLLIYNSDFIRLLSNSKSVSVSGSFCNILLRLATCAWKGDEKKATEVLDLFVKTCIKRKLCPSIYKQSDPYQFYLKFFEYLSSKEGIVFTGFSKWSVKGKIYCINKSKHKKNSNVMIDVDERDEYLLPVEIVNSDNTFLDEFTNQYFQENTIQMQCSDCGQSSFCRELVLLQGLPDFMFFRVNRAKGVSVEIDEKIEFDFKREGKSKTIYRLFQSIIHRGSGTTSGHYISLLKRSPGYYYILDDEKVGTITNAKAMRMINGCSEYEQANVVVYCLDEKYQKFVLSKNEPVLKKAFDVFEEAKKNLSSVKNSILFQESEYGSSALESESGSKSGDESDEEEYNLAILQRLQNKKKAEKKSNKVESYSGYGHGGF